MAATVDFENFILAVAVTPDGAHPCVVNRIDDTVSVLEYTVLGDTVNVAMRLERLACARDRHPLWS